MKQTVAVVLDLQKAFEKMGHATLWEIGCRNRCPRRGLAMLIKACAGRRSLKFGTIASKFVRANQGVTA
eukprot:7759621-Pyramimonas_sp.AAC.1